MDKDLNAECSNPTSDTCAKAINAATQYIAMLDAWKFLKGDVARSSKNTSEQVYNSLNAENRFALYYNTIDKRADFFAASDQYEQHIGSKEKWFGEAEFVSRARWTGLGADGNFSAITFYGGSLLAGSSRKSIYAWRDEAGESLMNAGFNNFKDLYKKYHPEPEKWDINQLKNEQTVLQPIHYKYLKDRSVFNWVSEFITNSDNFIYRLASKAYIEPDPMRMQSGGIDILDYKSRIRYGCKLLGYEKAQGCSP